MKAILDAETNSNDSKTEPPAYDSGRQLDQEPYELTTKKRVLLSKLHPSDLVKGVVTASSSSYTINIRADNPMGYCEYDRMILTIRDFPNFTVDTLLKLDEYGSKTFCSTRCAHINKWIENTQAYKDYLELKTGKYLYKAKNDV